MIKSHFPTLNANKHIHQFHLQRPNMGRNALPVPSLPESNRRENPNNTHWIYSLACSRQTKFSKIFDALIIYLSGLFEIFPHTRQCQLTQFLQLALACKCLCPSAHAEDVCSPDNLQMRSERLDLNASSIFYRCILTCTWGCQLVTGSPMIY